MDRSNLQDFPTEGERIAEERRSWERQEGDTHGDILPIKRGPEGQLQLAIPQFLRDLYLAVRLPSDVLKGYQATPEDIVNFALNVGGGGVTTSAAAAKDAGPNAIGMFLGPYSSGANHQLMEQAWDMAEAGASREEIWKATGWFKAPDGRWKYEISDKDFKLTPDAEAEFYRQAVDPAYAELDRRGMSGPINRVLQHPGLDGQYPINPVLKEGTEAEVALLAPTHLRDFAGGYGINEGVESVFAEAKTPEQLLKTLIHELQHSVQQREGFGQGTNVTSATADLEKLREIVFRNLPRDAKEFIEAEDMYRSAPWDAFWRRRYETLAEKVEPYRKEMQDLLVWTQREAPWDFYRRKDGEVEANLTAARIDMDDEQRRAVPPWLMYDKLEQFSTQENEIWNADILNERIKALKDAVAASQQPARYAKGGMVELEEQTKEALPPGAVPSDVADDVDIKASEGHLIKRRLK